MDNDTTLTNDTQPDAVSTPAAGGEKAGTTADDTPQAGDTLSLAEINSITGKQFKDKDTALKSLKDMSSQAGKAADLEGRNKDLKDLQAKVEKMEADKFFDANAEYGANRTLIEALAKANGQTFDGVIATDAYKDAKRAAPKEKRTVMDSTRRTQSSESRDKDFEEARKSGKWGSFVVRHHMGDTAQ